MHEPEPESIQSTPSESVAEREIGTVRLGPLRLRPQRQIYAVIIILATLAVVPESTQSVEDSVLYLSAIIIAPMFALMMAHAFSEAAAMQIRLERRLAWAERRSLFRENLEFIWVGLLFALLLVPFTFAGTSEDDALSILQLFGLALLFGWGYVVAAHAKVGRWRRLSMGLGYAVLGLLIILIEAIAHHLDEVVIDLG